MSLLHEIFSVKTKGNKKIIRILGIKFTKKILSDEVTKTLSSMHVTVLDPDNKIFVIENGQEKEVPSDYFVGLKITLKGKNNIIKIHAPFKFFTSRLEINGENNLFEIETTGYAVRDVHFSMMSLANNRKISIGNQFACGGALIVNNVSGNTITIWDDCMFGRDIIVRADDGHVICQKGTKKIINNSSGTKIGNHVWIAQRTFVGKDVEIGDNSVVGACSVITKGSTEQNVVWAGVPARIIKRDIDWYRVNHNSDMFER